MTDKLLKKFDFYIENWASWLFAHQVCFNQTVSSLHHLNGKKALNNGRRFDITEIKQNPKNTKLWKVGLIGDTKPDVTMVNQNLDKRKTFKKNRNFINKFKRHLLAPNKNKISKVLNFALGRIRHLILTDVKKTIHKDTDWAALAGVNFFQKSDHEFICIDYGGIYEDLLTIDQCRYPSQVGIDLYTSSCAAYVFSYMAKHNQAKKWLRAKDSSLEYHRHYFNYPRQRLEFNHMEFDFTPLHLAFGEQISNQFRGWTHYDPVNVFGLRWDNISQEKTPSILRKFIIWIEIYRNQKAEGLIGDNHMGRATKSVDLGYHQYCLAGLSFGNSVLNSKSIDNIIKKGLVFSNSLQLPNGEVGYYGRGANSNYHLASYIVSLSYAMFKFGWDTNANIDRALNYLNTLIVDKTHHESQLPSGPALNASTQSSMMGWHGSGAQYGALSAFLLARSRAFLVEARSNRVKLINPPIFESHKGLTHYKIIDNEISPKIVLSFTSGGDLVEWNLGQHKSGFAGLTSLSILGKNRLLTNEVINDDGEDYFLQDIQGQTKSSQSKMLHQDKICTIKTTDNKFTLTTQYQISDGYWTVYQCQSDSSAKYALPLMNLRQVTAIDERSVMISFMDGAKLKVESDQKFAYDTKKIKRSCQGPGMMVYFLSPSNIINLKFSLYSSDEF